MDSKRIEEDMYRTFGHLGMEELRKWVIISLHGCHKLIDDKTAPDKCLRIMGLQLKVTNRLLALAGGYN